MKKIKKKKIALIALIIAYLYMLSLFLFPFYIPKESSKVKVFDGNTTYYLTDDESSKVVEALKWHRFIPIGETYFCTGTPKIIIEDIAFGIDFKGDTVLYSEKKKRFLYISKSKMKVIHNILDNYDIDYLW